MLKRILLSLMMATTLVFGVGIAAAAPDLAITGNSLVLDLYGGSGDTLTVSFGFTNSGTTVATGASITYTLPTELEFAAVPLGWNVVGQTATLTGDFAPGFSIAGGFIASIKDFYTYRTVTGTMVASVVGDTNTSNNTLTDGVMLGYAYGLQKVISEINGSAMHNGRAIQGDLVEFTMTFTNSGTVPFGVNLTDTVAGISTMMFAQSSYVNVYSQILPGASTGFSITGTVTAPSFSSIVNTVNAYVFPSSTLYSQLPQLAAPTAAATVLPQAVIGIVKNPPAIMPQPGTQFAYQLVVTNSGSTSVVFDLQDILPSSAVSFVSMSRNGTAISPAGPSCAGLGICDFTSQTIAANSTLTYTLTGLILGGAPSTFINTGQISTADATAIVAIPQDTASVTLAGVPDLFITKTLSTSPASILQSGDLVVFSFTFGNSGNQTITGALITDTFTSQLSYVSGTLGGVAPTQVGSTLTFTGLNLASGSSVGPQTLTFRVTNVAAEGQNFANTGTISLPAGYPTGYEQVLSNNTSGVTGSVIGLRNLFIRKTLVGSAPTLSGDLVTYQITAGNSGNATRSIPVNMIVTDLFPSAYYNYVSSTLTPSSTGAGTASWLLTGPFAMGQSQTFNVTLQLNSNPVFGTPITNTGAVNLTGLGPVLPQVITSSSGSTTFLAGGSPDFSITKTPSVSSLSGVVGSGVVYTVAYANIGTSGASNVTVVDVLPTGMVPALPLTSGGVYNATNNTITWTLASLGTGSNGTGILTYTGVLSQLFTGTTVLNNVVTIDSSNAFAESNETNNISTGSVTVTPLPDIAILSKSIQSLGAPVSGSTTVFVINYINNGSVTGSFFAIADTLPTIFNYTSGCSVVGAGAPVILCPSTVGGNVMTGVLSPVGPGQTGQLILPMTLNMQPVGTVNFANTAILNFDDPTSHVDGNINNDIGSVSGQFVGNLNVQVTKVLNSLVASGGIDMSGALATFTVTLVNNGNIPVVGNLIDGWPVQYLSNNNASLNISGISLATGSSQTFMFSGNLLGRDVTSFQNFAYFNYTVGSTGYSSTGSVTVNVPQPLCGNQILEVNEQCENIGSNIYSTQPLLSGQSCVSCQVRTTSVLNVGQLCIGPGFTDCDTSTVYIPVDVPNPTISIDKSVTPSANLQSGDLVTYTMVLHNSGSTVNNVVFQDIWPWAQVAYVSHTTSPVFTLNVDTSSQIMSGTIPVFTGGATYTVTVVGRVQTNTVGTVNNVATATYTNNLNQIITVQDNAIINIGQGGLCNDPVILGSRVIRDGSTDLDVTCQAGSGSTSSTQIVINCGNGSSYTGAGSSYTHICTYTDDNTYTVSCSVDGYTDNSCQETVNIIDPTLNICGDGVISQLESCDLGSSQQNGVYVPIGSILGYNLNGNAVPSGIHEGASCYNCAIIDDVNPVTPPVCTYTDTSLSVMEGEYLPFRWNVEIDKGSIGSVNDCDSGSIGSVIRDSMICEFAIINNNDGDEVIDTVTFPCDQELDYDIFNSFTSTTSEHTDVDDSYGRFLIQIADNLDAYGEYKIRLEKVHYNYCALQNGQYSSLQGIPYCRVCETNFTVTRPYLMQVGASSAAATDSLEDFYDIRGDQILTSSELGDIDSIRYSDYDGGGNIRTLLSSFVSKYSALGINASVNSFGGATSVKKVPGRNIFIVEGDVTYQHNTSLGSATIIVKGGDLEIRGNVGDNIMFLVPDGTISFSDSDNSCSRQFVKGILVAGEGFDALDESDRHINNDVDKERCREGGLTVQGVMVGENIEDLVLSKRSNLNHWFTFDDSVFGNAEKQRRERRDEIINGASVLIQYNSSLWSSLPPGGSEIVETLNISKN